MTLEQLLTKKGYSKQEVEDLKPLLSNAKFRKDLEDELTGFETETTKMKSELDSYDKWFMEEITPEHEKLIKAHDDAVAEAAALKAKMEVQQRRSMSKAAGKTDAEIAAEEAARKKEETDKGGTDMSKYITSDVFTAAYERTGEAIASAINITSEHMQLFPGQFLDMEQLRLDAKKAKQPVKEYWKNKYGVDAKKAEIAARAKEAEAEKYRQEGYQKAAAELGGNPNLRTPVQSESPFVARKKKDADKQPWDKNPSELTRNRLDSAIKKAAERGNLASA